MTTQKIFPCVLEGNIESLPDAEKSRISLEVQDSFSFLDSQDPWLGDSLDWEYPRKSSQTAFDCRGSADVGSFSVSEDDLGSGFMNEMIGGGMQVSVPALQEKQNVLAVLLWLKNGLLGETISFAGLSWNL